MKRTKKLLVVAIIFSLLVTGTGLFVHAQTDKEKEREELEAELERLEREIAEAQRDVTATEAEKQSLQHQIDRLQGEINHLTAQINRNRAVINKLGLQIADTQDSIIRTTNKIEQSREELSEILRAMQAEGRTSTVEILLAEDDLSSVFGSLNSLERLSDETRSILTDVKDLRRSLEGYKEELEEDKQETERIARIQEAQKREEEAARRERESLYEMTEEEYQRQVAEKEELEKRAEEIRNRLFELVGVPDTEAPTFEEAYEIAKWVESITGIRPAFLLSIIQQESALGKNVGQCHLADTHSGASVHISTGQRYSNGIHPSRDIPPFITITSELGKDPLKTPVSCPMSVGYGGAMGPAQFIPSTWQSIRGQVRNILGREPNPWSIRDSFLASGVLLTNSGAGSRTRQGEWNAAMIYFSGSTTNSSFFWYADQVIDRADRFDRDIEVMIQ